MQAFRSSNRPAELIAVSFIFLFSVVAFGLGVEYARQAANSPVDLHGSNASSLNPNPSTARIIFYAVTMPFLSLIYSALHLASLQWLPSILSPVSALVASLLLLCGWVIQTAMWSECVMNVENDIGICFQPKLVSNVDGGKPRFVNEHIHDALVAFGFVLMVASLGLVIYQSIRLHKQRMAKKRPSEIDMKTLESGGSL